MMMTQEIQAVNLTMSGRKHRDKGTPCEDASLSVFQNGVHVICLSDGAGASQYIHADIGSTCVVKTVCDLLSRNFDAFFFEIHESIVRSVLVAAIQSELALISRDMSIDGMDTMSATMMFCAIKDTRMICGHIGDGVIARVTGSGLQPVFLPQNGEDTSSTIFVTLPDAQDYLRILRTTIDDTHAIVLMTDGLSDMVYDGTKLLLMPVVARLAELADLPKDECDIQLSQTLRSFIIDSSPLSDDASIGILYLENTTRPDPDSIPTDKPNCLRQKGNSMHSVQMEILPRVREAQSIMVREFLPAEETSAVGEKEERPKVSIDNNSKTDSNPSASNSEEAADDIHRSSSRKFSFDWKNALLGGSFIILLFMVGLLIHKLLF